MEDLIFVTAQPDVPYFHWQVRVYVHNFIEMGINPNQIHIVFAMVYGNTEPTEESLDLKKLGVNVHHYLDERKPKRLRQERLKMADKKQQRPCSNCNAPCMCQMSFPCLSPLPLTFWFLGNRAAEVAW